MYRFLFLYAFKVCGVRNIFKYPHENVPYLLLLSSLSFVAQAGASTSLDLRHEFKHYAEQHRNRLTVNHATDFFYYKVQTEFSAKQNEDGSQDLFGTIKVPNGNIDVGTNHVLSERWLLQPGIRIGGGKGFYATELQLLLGYKAKTFPLQGYLRYRQGYLRYRRQIKNQHEVDKKSAITNRVTLSMTYSYGDNKYWLKTNHYRYARYNIYDKSQTNYDYGVGAGRKFDNWYLYVELFNVGYIPKTPTRQLRSILGVKYTF